MRVGLGIVASGALGMAVITALLAPAHAQTLSQSDDARARTHFEAGRSYYEQAQYEEAAREFQESFDLSGPPELLLNISQAQERALRYDDAIGAARRYLELVPSAENRKTIEERILSLQELKKRFEEGGPAPLAPPGDTSTLAPLAGSPTSGTAPGAAGTPGTTPPASAPPSAAGAEAGLGAPTQSGPDSTPVIPGAASEPESKYTIPAIVLMGAGGASLVAALVTGIVAHADYNSLERQCRGNRCPVTARDELDEGKTLSVVSTVLTIVGVVAAGAGGALLVVGARESHESPGRVVEPRASQPRAGVTPFSVSGKLSF